MLLKIVKNNKFKKGSALVLTMFILAGMMIVALSGSYIVLVGIKSAGFQAQSTRAYFAAEAGTEQILYEMRKKNWLLARNPSLVNYVFSGTLETGPSYKTYYLHFDPTIFSSIGEYNKTKRSVEIRI